MTPDSTELPAALRARLAADPLWDFALALYARPGAEAACLHLQDDAGVEVIELLWRLWLFRHGLAAGPMPDAVARWQAEVTAPLRRLRRSLKAEAAEREGVAALRQRLKAAELDAEREALVRLETHSLDDSAGHRSLATGDDLQDALPFHSRLTKASHLSALGRLNGQLDPS
ncbi:TIGR02444 family protein [Halomonas getboli]|uniref:TIGR02444 family protein n=1 Tax=Halomonas getboli TaxID=2935862 RepID=UPI001FFF2B28|nr:TIGR02444 family protein [Halomonas getboli]MCK2185655.1 TIGR02444 family protein [Halomonas getboli]